ncbi:MAG: response regulator [Myxococcales bacterium]|nr:MAG: response regulator [Myxococcales bacterium]
MEKQANGVRVMLVDDERDFLDSMARALSRRGFAVTTATNGMEALEICENERFDVAVIDIRMPVLDGQALFNAIRMRHAGLPVIILTGHGTIQQAFEFSKRGLFDYLTKPCEVEALAARILDAHRNRGKTALADAPDILAEPIRALIVDDEAEFLDSISRVLSRRGFSVATAHDAAEALDRLEGRTFDVVLADVRMPGVDGPSLLTIIKKRHPQVEVILLTGHASIGSAVVGLKHGAFDYLLKSQEIDDLIAKLRAAAAQSRRAREEERRLKEAEPTGT